MAETARSMMDQALNQMVRLVDDLLDASRITTGKLQLRKERVELAAVVQSVADATRPMIDEQGQKLTVALPAAPILLDADPTRLAQVFSNLLNNATKYSEAGGQIALSAETAGDQVIVRVRDAGIGHPGRSADAHLRDLRASGHDLGEIARRLGHRAVANQGIGGNARRYGRGAQRRAGHGERVYRPPTDHRRRTAVESGAGRRPESVCRGKAPHSYRRR